MNISSGCSIKLQLYCINQIFNFHPVNSIVLQRDLLESLYITASLYRCDSLIALRDEYFTPQLIYNHQYLILFRFIKRGPNIQHPQAWNFNYIYIFQFCMMKMRDVRAVIYCDAGLRWKHIFVIHPHLKLVYLSSGSTCCRSTQLYFLIEVSNGINGCYLKGKGYLRLL